MSGEEGGGDVTGDGRSWFLQGRLDPAANRTILEEAWTSSRTVLPRPCSGVLPCCSPRPPVPCPDQASD